MSVDSRSGNKAASVRSNEASNAVLRASRKAYLDGRFHVRLLEGLLLPEEASGEEEEDVDLRGLVALPLGPFDLRLDLVGLQPRHLVEGDARVIRADQRPLLALRLLPLLPLGRAFPVVLIQNESINHGMSG